MSISSILYLVRACNFKGVVSADGSFTDNQRIMKKVINDDRIKDDNNVR